MQDEEIDENLERIQKMVTEVVEKAHIVSKKMIAAIDEDDTPLLATAAASIIAFIASTECSSQEEALEYIKNNLEFSQLMLQLAEHSGAANWTRETQH
jgi:hypothetical protein